MKRKVIQMAGKTMVISLPAEWVKKYGVKKGEELDITTKNKKLEISIEKLKESQKILNLDFSNIPDVMIKHTIAILHKMGFDELHIKYKTDEQFAIFEKVMNSMLLGYELIIKSKNICIIKSITKINEVELENIIRRNFFVILECSRVFLDIIKENNFNQLKKIKEYENKNNTLTNYSHRIINKLHEEQGSKFSYYYLILWELENICDEFKYMADFFIKINNGLTDYKEKSFLMVQTDKLINSYYNLFYKLDIVSLDNFITECNTNQKELENKLSKKLQKEVYFFIFSLLEITKRLRSLVGSTLILEYLKKEGYPF